MTPALIKEIVTGSLMVNTYLLICQQTKETAIIDPGGDAHHIKEVIAGLGGIPKMIINTHGHADHVGAVLPLHKAYQIPVGIHPADQEMMAGRNKIMESLLPNPAPYEADFLLDEEQTLQVGNLSVTVLATPGHTLGGVCFVCDTFIFTGDTLFAQGIGRTDLPGGSLPTLLQSIKKIYALDPLLEVLPGHGGSSTVGYENDNNPFTS